MSKNEMVAYALEVSPKILPFMDEILEEFDELGSSAQSIVHVLQGLGLSLDATILDLGCGKGVVAVEIAKRLGLKTIGIELYEPFLRSCCDNAAAAGVTHLCSFAYGDASNLKDLYGPADAVVIAALGDTLGSTKETVGVIRRYVKPGGYIVISDVYLKEGVTETFPDFEYVRTYNGTIALLTAHGDTFIQGYQWDDTETDDDHAVASVRAKALDLATKHPELSNEFIQFADSQDAENKYIEDNLVNVIWVIKKKDEQFS